ncbi:hypothetical protein HK100_001349 [Physocladia obscura]|uniref:Elongation factor Ts, mitochondrial n=1 Tax=Physocladia obscura TaxID=109957 RepID=A0AAD5SZV8_9FUNG|nr:hypothetical protein HK100_001349 [Physocladia obscura]
MNYQVTRLLRRFNSSSSTTANAGESLASLVAKLRKETGAPIGKARTLLTQHNNNYAAALAALRDSSATVSEKMLARTAAEGLVAAFTAASVNSTPPKSSFAGIVEINCESDFVARAADFATLVDAVRPRIAADRVSLLPLESKKSDEAHTFFHNVPSETLAAWSAAPPISEQVAATIAKLGENIRVRRAILSSSFAEDSIVYGAYAHGGSGAASPLCGKIAAIVALRVSPTTTAIETSDALNKLARQIAQQVVGFSPTHVHQVAGVDNESILYLQPFLAGGGTVAEVLQEFGKVNSVNVEVLEFQRVVVGEGIIIEKKDFRDEVFAQLQR